MKKAGCIGLVVVLALGGGMVYAQANEEATQALLNAGRRAYNEGQYPVAADRFREFLKQNPNHKDAPSAQYGLGLALLEAQDRDYKAAADALELAARDEKSADRPYVLYHLGVARRGMAEKQLKTAEGKNPQEAAQLRDQARSLFIEAAKQFGAAATAFADRVKAADAAAPLPVEAQWAGRARVDQAQSFIRAEKYKEALEAAQLVLGGAVLGKTAARDGALYQAGYASFLLKDYVAAGRSLGKLAPFGQEFGPHARYLLGRAHQMAEERAEAVIQFKAVIADFDKLKKAAAEALRNAGGMRPEQRVYYETLATGPAPDYLQRSIFYLGVVAAEQHRFVEAADQFAAFVQQYPKSPLIAEAQLRLGMAQVELKQWDPAKKVLDPVREHPLVGDQAMLWWARAQIGSADPANAQAYEQTIRTAADTLRRAADRTRDLAKTDPTAKPRRAEMLVDLGDSLGLIKQYKDAASAYATVVAESLDPEWAEQAMGRQVTALHLAGQYKDSDDLARRFEQTYPKSLLLPAVAFRSAENAYFTALAAEGQKKPDAAKLFDEAIARYRRVVEKWPEFAQVNLARQGIGAAYYRMGKFAEAAKALDEIPGSERSGDLLNVAYMLADCLIRTLPPEGDDAVSTARMMSQAENAAKLLEQFTASAPKSPQLADAYLKLGYCYQRCGMVLADPTERKKVLEQAKTAYSAALRDFGRDLVVQGPAVYERAKCLALMGDDSAVVELRRFQGDRLRPSPVMPLAIVRLASLLRAQGKAAEAAQLLTDLRTQEEQHLRQDPERKDWVPLIAYEHALALKDSGKSREARTMFEAIAKEFTGRPEATNATWRAGQCRREELTTQLDDARRVANKPGASAEETAATRRKVDETTKAVRDAATAFEAQAADLAKKDAEASLRLTYEAAWCWRALAAAEKDPLPLDQKAMELYQKMIAASPEAPLANQARVELAALRSSHRDHDAAAALLTEAMEKNPTPELAERVRLQLAQLMLARGDAKSAIPHALAASKSATRDVAAEGRYWAGEAYFAAQDWPKAIEQLIVFRDQDPYRQMPAVADRALLRLGLTLAQASRWDESRTTLDQLIQRFPNSPLADEARFNIGLAYRGQRNFDAAINAFTDVTRRTVAEVAARAQLEIGRCRIEQKKFDEATKALLAVPVTYDYPECKAAAWAEAGRAYMGLKQRDQATRLWQRVVKEQPSSPWAATAKKWLAELQ